MISSNDPRRGGGGGGEGDSRRRVAAWENSFDPVVEKSFEKDIPLQDEINAQSHCFSPTG